LIAGVIHARAAVDFSSADSLLLQIRVEAEKEIGGQLEFMVPLAMPMLAQQVQRRYGLTMQPETSWNAADSTYEIDITLTGIEEKLKSYFQRALPRRPAPASPPTEG